MEIGSLFNTFKSAILAGICIALGGAVFLKAGGIIGAVLFSFGLLTVVHYKLKLYTGTAGFIEVNKSDEWVRLVVILLGNIVGCFLMSLIVKETASDSVLAANGIIQKRLEIGPIGCGLLAICCGFIMTTAVQFGREGKFLPLLFGVPLFIMSGFTHSIADAFYFLCNPLSVVGSIDVLTIYICEVIGNFIGCNLYRATCLNG